MPDEAKKPTVGTRVATIATVISTLIAAGGLYFTAAAVRQSAQVQANQNAQMLKSQARLINVVPESEPSPSSFIVTVTNRSEEPIYRLYVYIAFPASPSDTNHGIFAAQSWQSMSGCVKVSFNLGAIANEYRQTAAKKLTGTPTPTFDYGLVFTDSSGQTWHRHAAGFTHTTPWLETVSGPTHMPVLPPVYANYQLFDNAPVLVAPLAGESPTVTSGPSTISPCTDPGT